MKNSILETLMAHPNERMDFEDNAQIKECLLALGLITCFVTKTPNGFPTPRSVQCLEHLEHPTHYLIFLSYIGFEKAHDNGYAAMGLPKSKFSPAMCRSILEQLADKTSDGTPPIVQWKHGIPAGSRAN